MGSNDLNITRGFPGGSDSKVSVWNAEDLGSIAGLGRSPGKGNGYSTVFLPGEFQGQESLVGYSSRDSKGLDTTERLTHIHTHKEEIQFINQTIYLKVKITNSK